jgi:hypothetical protein
MGVSARGLAATMAMACMASAFAACSLLPSPSQRPAPVVFEPPDLPPGAADKALQALDPEAVLRSVAGGRQCRAGSLIGSHGSYHMIRNYVCPRAGDDRTVYFLFTEDWEAALLGTGATSSSGGSSSSDASEPIATDWALAGETMVGTSRVLGVNGPGTLTLFVSLDLVVP